MAGKPREMPSVMAGLITTDKTLIDKIMNQFDSV